MKTYFVNLNGQIDQINQSKNLNNLSYHYLILYFVLTGAFKLIELLFRLISGAQTASTSIRNAAPEFMSRDTFAVLFLGTLLVIFVILAILHACYAANGETILSGAVIDQAALHGVLNRIRDLGLTLTLVRQTEDGR